jgi:adenylylsulfate kinase-like enzyme
MPRLIILRGNSGSGKSTVAREIRQRMGYGTALVEQDYIRRVLLREKDRPNQPNISLIDLNVRFALGQGYDVVLEGILPKKHYGDMLHKLLRDIGGSHVYYFDIPLEETLRRHQTKANSHEFGEAEMRQWHLPGDVLGVENERIITQDSSLDATVERILNDISS